MAGFQNRLGAAWVREGEHLGPIRLRDRRMSSRTCNYLESIGFLGSLCLLVGGHGFNSDKIEPLGIFGWFGYMKGRHTEPTRSDRVPALRLRDWGCSP